MPVIDAIWENRTIEDHEMKNSTVRNVRMEGRTEQEIAEAVGFKTASALRA